MRGIVRLALLSATALVAAALVLEAGSRGFQAFDQSIVFDGGYRVFLGQRPYRDFFLPSGPVPMWIQALFFAIFGVGYRAYLAHAAVVNGISALLAYAVVRLAMPREHSLFAFGGALLTAFWFYPPFGTPFLEQSAFFFHLGALSSLLFAIQKDRGRFAGLAGVLVTLSFLCKQNAGVLSLVTCALVALVSKRRGNFLLRLGAGSTVTGIWFGLWVLLRSRAGHFWTFFFEIPAGEGVRRLGPGFLKDLLLEELSFRDPVRTVSALALFLALSVLVSRRARGELALPATVVLSLFLFQSLFLHLTNNEPENSFAFCGILAALGAAMGHALVRDIPAARLAVLLSSSVLGLGLASYGREVALSRRVHDVFFRSRFDDAVVSEALPPVRWGLPTPAARRRAVDVRREDFDGVARYLRETEGNFFVFPDFTVLYGITGKRPPQPLLWFHEGLTYPREPSAWLDERIVSDLERNRVTHVVLEKESLTGMAHRMSDFPRLQRYVETSFEPDRAFGIFQVLRRR